MNSYEEKLKAIVGEGNYFKDHEDLLCYSYDATYLTGKTPSIVLFPTTTGQVSEIMKVAYAEEIPVIPRGAGTCIAGNYMPIDNRTIVIDLKRMNKIVEIDRENLTATVEAGVITLDFSQAVDKMGLFYPPDPSSQKNSTMGGNVALNAGGPRGAKYGNTLAYVLGLEVVLADGRILKTGSKCLKQSSGYNLAKLFVGSEGTLGIVTRVILKLLPKPEAKKTMLAIFNKLDEAAQAVSEIIAGGIIPATLELMDNKMIALVDQFKPTGFPLDAEAILIIEVDGPAVVINDDLNRIIEICNRNGVRTTKTAQNVQEAEKIWEARRSSYGVFTRAAQNVLTEDITVPRNKFPEMMRRIREIADKYQVNVVCVAHAGDGNTHPAILADLRNEDEKERVEKAMEETALAGIELGGCLSGEHGIGVVKKNWMIHEHGAVGLATMQSIKQALDPKNILNPGKLWNQEDLKASK